MRALTKIEDKLLANELKVLNDKLRTIGDNLADVFAKYGAMGGSSADVKQYLINQAIVSNPIYHQQSGVPSIDSSIAKIPDTLKEAILTWAVDDFFDKFNEVSDLMDEQ